MKEGTANKGIIHGNNALEDSDGSGLKSYCTMSMSSNPTNLPNRTMCLADGRTSAPSAVLTYRCRAVSPGVLLAM